MAERTEPTEVARERLRTAVTRVVDVFVSREATAGQLNTWAEISERFASQIEGLAPETVMWGFGSQGVLAVNGVVTLGKVEAPAPQAGDFVKATVRFGSEHQGHAGFAHGGVIAAAFDEIFGMLQPFRDPPIVTAELTVRYLSPLPLHRLVELEARIDEMSGRRVKVSGRASSDGRVYAEAEALFMSVAGGLPAR